MHKPSGLGIYGLYQHEEVGGRVLFEDLNADPTRTTSAPDTDVWYVKPFWRKAWSPIGATVLYGEWGQYNDQFGGLAGVDVENLAMISACNSVTGRFDDCFITGSEVERWGLGLVQEIDSAAMHLWVRWQHQELDVDFIGFDGDCNTDRGCRGGGSFDDWDLFQAGGIIFF
jgi:hypothetical protein